MPVRGDITRFVTKLTGALTKASSPTELRLLAQEAIEMIRTRTRLGYGVRQSGTKRFKLKPLHPGYVEFRRENRALLHQFATVKRSNLTFTGQMLDSMKVIRAKPNSVIIGPKGRRNDGLTNEEVAKRVSSNGRPFLHLSDLEIKKLRRAYELKVKKQIRQRRL